MCALLLGLVLFAEIDALQCLFGVHFARLAIFQAVEVEDAEGCVAGGLHLRDQDALAQRMDGAAGEEKALAGFDRHRVDRFEDGAAGDG